MGEKKISGKLILKEVVFDNLLIRKVGNNNETSGKVSLPKHMIGKTVYVIVKP
jgi:putative transposon-encoded protein